MNQERTNWLNTPIDAAMAAWARENRIVGVDTAGFKNYLIRALETDPLSRECLESIPNHLLSRAPSTATAAGAGQSGGVGFTGGGGGGGAAQSQGKIGGNAPYQGDETQK